jgi:hypothetical protein
MRFCLYPRDILVFILSPTLSSPSFPLSVPHPPVPVRVPALRFQKNLAPVVDGGELRTGADGLEVWGLTRPRHPTPQDAPAYSDTVKPLLLWSPTRQSSVLPINARVMFSYFPANNLGSFRLIWEHQLWDQLSFLLASAVPGLHALRAAAVQHSACYSHVTVPRECCGRWHTDFAGIRILLAGIESNTIIK